MPTAPLCSLVVVLGLAAGGAAPARTVVDERAGAVGGFWACVRGPTCRPGEVFATAEAREVWARNEHQLRAATVGALALVPRLPAAGGARFKAEWPRHVQDLVAAGYRRAELEKLGAGSGLVQASEKVALGLMSAEIVSRGQTKKEFLFLVLWRTAGGYRVALYDDSIRKVVTFMKSRKP